MVRSWLILGLFIGIGSAIAEYGASARSELSATALRYANRTSLAAAARESPDPRLAALDLESLDRPHLAAPAVQDTGDTPPSVFGFGRMATAAEVEAWDIDVMADGTGLPPGSGTVPRGAEIYAAQCASCHGPDGEGGAEIGLVGRIAGDAFPFAEDQDAKRRIGSYWPYAPTLFDYIRRTMPFDRPGSLTDDEVYSLTAYLLHLNEIVPEDAVMDAETLPAVKMPARNRFVPDDRLDFDVVH